MINSYRDALTKLLKVQSALNAENLATLPAAQVVNLEKAKAGVYGEIQALQAQETSSRDDDYQVVTDAFGACKSDLQDLSNWMANKRKTDGEIFDALLKGVNMALSLFL